MAMPGAQEYFASFPPEEQQRIRESWGGQDLLNEWFKAALAAGDLNAVRARAEANAGAGTQSEDMKRFAPGDLKRWQPYYDQASGKYRSMRGAPGLFEKPTECPPGQVPSGPDETDPCTDNPNAGGGPGGPGGEGGNGFGNFTVNGAPKFQYDPFKPPTWEEVQADPGHQFRLNQGVDAIQKSAAASGLLRSGGTLKDILAYGQDLGTQDYQNAYNQKFQTWSGNLGANQFQYNSQYAPWALGFGANENRWQTNQNTALQKYLQRENNIFGLLNTPPPAYPGGGV